MGKCFTAEEYLWNGEEKKKIIFSPPSPIAPDVLWETRQKENTQVSPATANLRVT